VARFSLAPAFVVASLGLALPAAAADPPAGAPTTASQPSRASQPRLQGDEASLRTGEPPTKFERVESENRPPSSVRFPTVLGGLAVAGGFWGLGAASASIFDDQSGMRDLRTPVAGPWMAIANNRCESGGCSLGDVARYIWFGFNGIGQVGGLALVLEAVLLRTGSSPEPAATPSGTTSPRPSLVPAPDSPAAPPADPSKPLFFLPMPIVVGREGVGVGWGGVF
jgi:hypothetical protein